MKNDNVITQELLYQLFHYRDGYLYWREFQSPNAKPGIPIGKSTRFGWYPRVTIGNKKYVISRLTYIYHHGPIPENYCIDHIDQNKHNNRIENLRLVTKSQNGMNRGKNNNNTSGYKGVSYYKAAQKWQATIKIDYNMLHLGLFNSIEDAIKARKTAELNLYGKFSPDHFQNELEKLHDD